MNSLKRLNGMTYVALAVLAIALGSGLANAQDVEASGKFNLPFTAQWGSIALAPGQYSFTLARTTGGTPTIMVRRGARAVGTVLVYAESDHRLSGPSHLTAVAISGGYQVTSLQLSSQGIDLAFARPKHEVLEASNTSRPARNVPVMLAEK
ncbi:MAG: hypothetical protein ACRD06_09305 [Terriglobia bacterium]